jgi:hypothetical protein
MRKEGVMQEVYSKVAVSGECSLKDFLNGEVSMPTFKYGVRNRQMVQVSLNKC